MKAQVSMEYLLITGFAFLLVIPLFIMFGTQNERINYDVTVSQAKEVADEIVKSADSVYYLGEGSKKSIRVYIPRHVENITIDGRMVELAISIGGTNFGVNAISQTNMTGSINPGEGVRHLEITAEEDRVRIE